MTLGHQLLLESGQHPSFPTLCRQGYDLGGGEGQKAACPHGAGGLGVTHLGLYEASCSPWSVLASAQPQEGLSAPASFGGDPQWTWASWAWPWVPR